MCVIVSDLIHVVAYTIVSTVPPMYSYAYIKYVWVFELVYLCESRLMHGILFIPDADKKTSSQIHMWKLATVN